jgi:hypothetical protein
MNDRTQERGAIGGTSSLGAQQNGTITYGAMPEQLAKQLQGDTKGEFIVFRKTHQSDPVQVWSTGDPEQTKSLFREAYEQLAMPATT